MGRWPSLEDRRYAPQLAPRYARRKEDQRSVAYGEVA